MSAKEDSEFGAEDNAGYGEEDKSWTVALDVIRWIGKGGSFGGKTS